MNAAFAAGLRHLLSFCFAKKKEAKKKATSNGIAPRVRSSYTLLSFGSIRLHGAGFSSAGLQALGYVHGLWGSRIFVHFACASFSACGMTASIGLQEVILRTKKGAIMGWGAVCYWAFLLSN
jgi:hypothetical protein